MSTGTGYLAKCVIVPETSYGALAGSGEQSIHLASENLTQQFEPISNELKSQDAAAYASEHGNEAVSGSTTFELDYDNGILELLECALGTKNISPTNFELADPNTESASLVIDKTVKRHQFLGGQIQRLTLSSSAQSQKLMADVEWIFQTLSISDTAIPTDAWGASEWIKHSQLVFRIGDTSDALAAGDELKVTDISVTIFNNFVTGDYVSGSSKVQQAIRAGYREVELSFTASRYNTDDEINAIRTAATGDSILQADLTWSGTGSNELVISIPEIKIMSVPPASVNGAAPLTYTVTGRCFANNNNQTYMSGVAKELEINHAT